MLEKFILVMGLVCIAWPCLATANTGVVRGGEHEDFTRLTISTETDISSVRYRPLGAAAFSIEISPKLDSLDTTRLFDRLSANRIKSLVQNEEGIVVTLQCDCNLQVASGTGRLAVIDIARKPSQASITLPLLPIVTGDLPNLRLTQGTSDTVIDKYNLDYLFVDQLTKSLASQISDTSHIGGFSDVGAKTTRQEDKPFELEAAVSDTDESEPAKAECFWSETVWTLIKGGSATEDQRINPQITEFDPMNDLDSAATLITADYLSQGLFDEARGAYVATDPSPSDIASFFTFLDVLNGSAAALPRRFGLCDPLFDLLVATSKNGADVPNAVRLELLHSFASLPLGLQIVLFQRLDWLLKDSNDALFADLIAYDNAEQALSERISVDIDVVEPDPDRLAAVSLELRNTEYEKESWMAAFNSFLEHRRYFDAIDVLNSENPLVGEEKEKPVSELVDRLVTHSDSVTFVQIALTVIPQLDPQPSLDELQRVAARLDADGFHEEANQFVNATMDGSLKWGETEMTENQSRTAGLSADAARLPQSASPVETESVDRLTVAAAQDQLESAGAVRQALIERFSR